MHKYLASIMLCLALSACGDWPDPATVGEDVTTGPWPVLLPLDQISSQGTGQDELLVTEELRARADALDQRAALLRRPIADQDGFERLRAQLAR